MSGLLADRVVLVTGAGRGVGRGIALACAGSGARVVIAEKRAEEGAAVAREIEAKGGGAHFAPCDVTRREAVDAAVAAALDRFGRLDAVVHNATSDLSPMPDDLATVDPGQLEDHMGVALRGALHCAQAAFEALREARGQLVVLTSPAGMEGAATLPLYSAVKGGQRGFVKSLAREWGREGVRVNAISPLAATPAMVRAFDEDPALRRQIEALGALGRIGDPEQDVGAVVTLLLSDRTGYVTGQTWVVDGGRFMGL